jgi:hypothetical protein
MSSLIEYRTLLANECYESLAMMSHLYIDAKSQDNLPGGEAENELLQEQINIMKRYRQIQQQRLQLVDDLIDKATSQDEDVA